MRYNNLNAGNQHSVHMHFFVLEIENEIQWMHEIAKITNSSISHKCYRKNKSDNGRTYQRWDQVPWRSKHPLPTGRTHHAAHIKRKNQ
jgi:hypothetical protein